MGRLIDEDKLINGRVENDPVVIVAKCTPTAYDVGKVVEQIKSLSPANYVSKDDVLKIVKGGGVNGKEQS